jgi:hypothetical protein
MRKHTASSASSINSRLPLMGIFYFRISTTAMEKLFFGILVMLAGFFLLMNGDGDGIGAKFMRRSLGF